jgi:flagellar protein FliS
MNGRITPWQSYRQVATQTATPGQLILMLYDGAIRFLEGALKAFGADDPLEHFQTINNNVQRAQAILQELSGALNVSQGGQLAETLQALYHYLDRRLQESNVRKEPGGIKEAIDRLTVLRDAWAQMLQAPAGSSPGPAPRPVGVTPAPTEPRVASYAPALELNRRHAATFSALT